MFKDRLRELRKKRKCSQKELAEKLGIAQTTVAGWETQDKEPDFSTLSRIADYFNVPTDYLLGIIDVESPDDLSDDQRVLTLARKMHKLNDDNKQLVDAMIDTMLKQAENQK